MLAQQMRRMEQASALDEIVVAVPDTRANESLAEYVVSKGWSLYRGPEDDVLARYAGAAKAYDADIIMRLTADCPLIDPGVINSLTNMMRIKRRPDFVSNNIERTFPHGLDLQGFTRRLLKQADTEATDAYDRQHVVPWMMRAPGVRRLNVRCPMNLAHHRWTVDTEQDVEFVRAVYRALSGHVFFTTADVLSLLERKPELMEINAEVPHVH